MPGRKRCWISGRAKWMSVGPSRPSPIRPARPGPPAAGVLLVERDLLVDGQAAAAVLGRPADARSSRRWPARAPTPCAPRRTRARRRVHRGGGGSANSPRRWSAIQSRIDSRKAASSSVSAVAPVDVVVELTAVKLTRTDDPSEKRCSGRPGWTRTSSLAPGAVPRTLRAPSTPPPRRSSPQRERVSDSRTPTKWIVAGLLLGGVVVISLIVLVASLRGDGGTGTVEPTTTASSSVTPDLGAAVERARRRPSRRTWTSSTVTACRWVPPSARPS